MTNQSSPAARVREIRRKTRRRYTSEEKVRIVPVGKNGRHYLDLVF